MTEPSTQTSQEKQSRVVQGDFVLKKNTNFLNEKTGKTCRIFFILKNENFRQISGKSQNKFMKFYRFSAFREAQNYENRVDIEKK